MSLPYAGTLLGAAPADADRSWHWKRLPVMDRIIGRSEQSGPCIVYTGPLRDGYGLIGVRGVTVSTHREMWESLVGPIPEGLTLDHQCRNHACWLPDHLEVVPKGVNTLRGYGPTAQNARATHCVNDHEFTDENTYVKADGSRFCRECGRARNRDIYHRSKELSHA